MNSYFLVKYKLQSRDKKIFNASSEDGNFMHKFILIFFAKDFLRCCTFLLFWYWNSISNRVKLAFAFPSIIVKTNIKILNIRRTTNIIVFYKPKYNNDPAQSFTAMKSNLHQKIFKKWTILSLFFRNLWMPSINNASKKPSGPFKCGW